MKKILKLTIILILIIVIGNVFVINVSTNESKNLIYTNAKKIILFSYIPIEGNAVKPAEETVIDVADIKDKGVATSDSIEIEHEQKNEEINYITIPSVCYSAEITVGSTQVDVDKYDICLMTEAFASFGEGKPILLGGHNTRSLKYLYKSRIGDVISINYEGNYYQYKVIYSSECTTDDYNLFDINNGKNVLEYRTRKEILQIYTCYGTNNRWFVKAVRIC